MEKRTFYILILLTLLSSTLFSIITPMAKELTVALDLESEQQVAFINSMFLLVGAVSSLIWAVFADKFSRKILLVIATSEWSIFTLLTILATDFYSFLIFQLLTAIGFGAALPLVYSLLIDLIEPKERGNKFGLFSAVFVLGNGVGQMLSGFLIDYYTWQIPILIVAIGGFFCTGLLIIIKEPQKGAMDSNSSDLELKIKKDDLKKIWTIRTTFWLVILTFVMFIAIGAISSFLISMFKNDFKFSSSLATILLIIIFGSQIPSGILFGNLGDKKFETDEKGRIKVIFICLLSGSSIYIVAYSMVVLSREFLVVILFLILIFIGAFLFGGIDPLVQATLGEINPPQIRSTIYSLNYLANSIGRSISLLFLGVFFLSYNYQYIPGYLILSIMALSCNIVLIPIFKHISEDLK